MSDRRLRLWAWAFLTPALVVYTVFWVFALVAGLSLGTMKWSGYGSMTFVGLHNLQVLLRDNQFYSSLGRNLQYGFFQITVGLALSLVPALILDRCRHGRLFFRTAIYLPVVLSWTVVAFLVRWLFNPSFGINAFLEMVGLGFLKADWLVNIRALFYLIIAVGIWKSYGFGMVTLFAGLQNVSSELREAAYIDGADELRCTWYVVLPLLKPVLAVVVSLSLMEAFRIFDPFYVLTNSSGGVGNIDLDVLAPLLYRRAFGQLALGDASALGFVLFVMTLAVSIFYLRTLGRSEE